MLCKYKKVEIVAGAVCADHVHLCVSVPSKLRISDFVGYLKGKSALMVYVKHPEMESKWDRSFWARGYYVSTIGNVNDETEKNISADKSKSPRTKTEKPIGRFKRQKQEDLQHRL